VGNSERVIQAGVEGEAQGSLPTWEGAERWPVRQGVETDPSGMESVFQTLGSERDF
jgi:hypothetical protein